MRKKAKKISPTIEVVRGCKAVSTMEFCGEDVVITDPCYLIKDDRAWKSFVDTVFGNETRVEPKTVDVGKLRMIVADTIYGDWACELRGTIFGEHCTLGDFTADAGMVAVTAIRSKAMRDILAKLPGTCFTILYGFTGKISIVHEKGACYVEGDGVFEDGRVTFRSVQYG